MLQRCQSVIIFWVLTLCLVSSVCAVSTIQVLALFKGKAVVKIDGQRRTLSLDITSPEGLKLITADSDKAVIEFNGTQKTYLLGNSISIGTEFRKPTEKIAQAISNQRGMFFIQGSANGHPIRFLVDTGATSIAMNEAEGKRLGIDYRLKGRQTSVATASGIAKAYSVALNVVKVGEIYVRNVDAVIIEGGFPTEVLLGMSFLSRVEIERSGNTMRFKQKF